MYDVIVVGARCAGGPTAMLLARRGYRVLLVDRATFPSDTLSTHFIKPPGVAMLRRWGLLDQVIASGCPPVTRFRFDYGPVVLAGSPPPLDGGGECYAPRRTILDSILVEAAAQAGAEVRPAFTVDAVLIEEQGVAGIRGHARGGATLTERARLVVGADGRRSLVARPPGADLCLLLLLERRAGRGGDRGLFPAAAGHPGLPHQRRPGVRLPPVAPRRVPVCPHRRRGARAGSGSAGARPGRAAAGRQAGGAPGRHRRPAQLLPDPLRRGLGARPATPAITGIR